MESRHDSENAERILYNMRPKELVSWMAELQPECPVSSQLHLWLSGVSAFSSFFFKASHQEYKYNIGL